MEIVDASLHQIDLDSNSIIVRDIDAGGEALKEYINKLLNDITVTSSRREFEFQSETKEARLSLGRSELQCCHSRLMLIGKPFGFGSNPFEDL